MTDAEKLAKVLQILINAAEFGDELDAPDLWRAIGELPEDHLSEIGLGSL